MRFKVLVATLVAGLLATLTLGVMIGPVSVAPSVVWRVALSHLAPQLVTVSWPAFQDSIVWDIRFPRVMLGGIVGAGLGVVGATMQALLRNALADPYLLGVSSGASLGAVAVIVLGITAFGIYSLAAAAFLGALLAFAAVYLVASSAGRLTTGRLILSGVALSYVLSALTNLLIYRAPNSDQVQSVTFWLMGGLSGARWAYVGLPAFVVVGGTLVLAAHWRTLNALSMGDETAATLGVDPNRVRRFAFVVTSLVTGTLVAVSGGIGFVGLMVPHIVRLVVGADHRRVLPLAGLVGAIFLMWVDVVARTIDAPQELPIGIITALCGAPFFLWLMRRNRPAGIDR